MRILLDGWAILHEPASPAALHLAGVLATLPDSVIAVLAIPGLDPGSEGFPSELEIQSRQTPNSAWGKLRWQQAILPDLANLNQSDLIYTPEVGASLLQSMRTISSPSGWAQTGVIQTSSTLLGRGIASRLQEALGMGGMNRSGLLLWPEDLPLPDLSVPVRKVPPLIHPLFQSDQPSPAVEFWPEVELPETYILYHGPVDQASMRRLLSAWSWAAASIAMYYPLLVYGVSKNEQDPILSSARQLGLEDSLLLLPPASPVQLAALYYGCSVFFQPGPVSPWGDPIRHAMACAKPVVAATSAWSDWLVGSAGFLAPPEDLRGLGAALISVIVEEDLAERLATGARQRTQGWSADGFWQAVLDPGSL